MPKPSVAVVGAGILGCMIAREVTARSPRAVWAVVDRDMIGSGASRRSAGLHAPSGGTERIRRMAGYSQAYYRALRRRDPALPIYPLGMTVVAAEESATRLRDHYLDEAGLRRTKHIPNRAVTIPHGAAAWHVEGCQYADVYALTQTLARDLRRHTRILEGVRAVGIEPTGNGVAVRLGTGDTLNVDHAVLAPGPWLCAPAWKSLVEPLGVRVKKIVALHIEQSPTDNDHAIVFPDEDAFLLPVRHRGHWLFSYTCREWDVDPDILLDGLSTKNIAEARRCLRRYAPSLAASCTSGRVFCDAYSRDGEPQVRPLDKAGRIVFAGAANGSGYRLAPAIASEAADLLPLESKVGSLS